MDRNLEKEQIDPYVLIDETDEDAILDMESEAVIGGTQYLYKDVYLGKIRLSNEPEIVATNETLDKIDDKTPFLGNYTVQEVLDIIDAGEAEDYWCIGDVTEPIELNGPVSTYTFKNESYKAMIIGFNHNAELETGGCYSMTLQFGQNDDGVNICFRDPNYDGGTSSSKTGFRMNDSNTNVGGWESCWMRSQIMEEFYEALPNSLQNVIGTTVKYTDNIGNASGSVESNVTATEDKIFLLSALEVFSASSYANTYEGNYQERYTWYSANDSDNARTRYKHFSPSSTSVWWLRSPIRSGSNYFCAVAASGSATYGYANISYGLAPAFTIIGGVMPTWTLDLVVTEESGIVLSDTTFVASSDQLVDLIDMGQQTNGYWLYTAKCQDSSDPTPLRINATSTIQNLTKEITSLMLKMESASDGYNNITDAFYVSLESDGRTAALSTDYQSANLAVISNYYAVLTIEETTGGLLPSH